jgi:hypothetical protein
VNLSKFNRYAAWLVWCAIFFGAIAPSTSHLPTSVSGALWVDICSVPGSQSIKIDIGSRPIPKAPISKECGLFCLLQNHAPVIPAFFGVANFVVAVVGDAPLSLCQTVPPTLFFRIANKTRAPPGFS